MLLPKCRTCGKRHRTGPCPDFAEGESSGRQEKSRSTNAAPVDSDSKDSPDRSSAGTVDTRGDADAKKPPTRNAPPADTSTSDGRTTPLTPAEKQKRYRERHGDEYRKRNRERMREKRNG